MSRFQKILTGIAGAICLAGAVYFIYHGDVKAFAILLVGSIIYLLCAFTGFQLKSRLILVLFWFITAIGLSTTATKYQMRSDILKMVKGKEYLQPMFQQLLLASITGMNYYIEDIDKSGELLVIRHIKEKLSTSESIILFDAGAHIGDYTYHLDTAFGITADIHAFEPNTHSYNQLKLRYSDKPNIIPEHLGLGEDSSIMKLYYNGEGTPYASVYQDISLKHFNKSEDVLIASIEDYCLQNKIDHIDFLKVDVQGHEYALLKGAGRMIIDKKIRFIQFEFGYNMPSRTYFRDYYDLLHENYDIYRVVKDGLYPIKEYRQEIHEVIASVNYFAALKEESTVFGN